MHLKNTSCAEGGRARLGDSRNSIACPSSRQRAKARMPSGDSAVVSSGTVRIYNMGEELGVRGLLGRPSERGSGRGHGEDLRGSVEEEM